MTLGEKYAINSTGKSIPENLLLGEMFEPES